VSVRLSTHPAWGVRPCLLDSTVWLSTSPFVALCAGKLTAPPATTRSMASRNARRSVIKRWRRPLGMPQLRRCGMRL
jgi:hypothetical protein